MKNNILGIKPQTLFLIIGLIYGLGFLLINPPFQGADDDMHFDKALYLSEGQVIPKVLNHYAGLFVPESTHNLELYFLTTVRDNHEKIGIDNITNQLYQPLNVNNKFFDNIVSTGAIITYSPVPYLASSFAIALGEILNFSPIILMYLGRLANLFIYLFIIYIAIRVTPIHKWVFLMLALMPVALFQGSSLSADSFTIAISFLVIAIFLKYSFDDNKKEININAVGILFGLMLMLVLSKQPYLFLIFLFFLIPTHKFGNTRKMFLVFCFLLISTSLISMIWNLTVNKFYVPNYPNVSIHNQISFLISHPFSFPFTLTNTILSTKILSNIIISFVGRLGWGAVILPNWLITIYIFILGLTSLLDKTDILINLKQKIIIFMTFLIVTIFICLSMYITGTPVGQNTIGSLDGRYLIPIAPLLFLLFYNNKIKFDIKKGFNLVIICLVIIALSITSYLLINNFYII